MLLDIPTAVPEGQEVPAKKLDHHSPEVTAQSVAETSNPMPSHLPPAIPNQKPAAPRHKLEELMKAFEEPTVKQTESVIETSVVADTEQPESPVKSKEPLVSEKVIELSEHQGRQGYEERPTVCHEKTIVKGDPEECAASMEPGEISVEEWSPDVVVEDPNKALESVSNHFSHIREALLHSKEQKDVHERESSPSEKTDVSSEPNFSDSSAGACLPSIETLVVEAPNLVSGYSVGVDCLPMQKERIIANCGVDFTIMVAGKSGLGKSTFINTLFDTCIVPTSLQTKEIPRSVTKCLVKYRAHFEAENAKLRLTVIDTPGFGDKCDNTFDWVPLVNYIDEQMRTYIFQEEQPHREEIMDDRVHCCLYFLEPTGKGLSTLDVIAMKEICKRVNMIPVIAKSDGLSHEELLEFKQEIRGIMESQGIKVCQFLKESSDIYRDIFCQAPFGVVGSDMKVLDSNGQTIHVRKYRWGTVEVENPDHCDFTLLKDVLISNHMVDFVRTTEEYYESCRASMLKTRILKARDRANDDGLSDQLGHNLQELDYDRVDNNGLKNYACYAAFGKKEMDSLVAELSPEFVQKRWEAGKKFNEVINLEDQKFQEWKKALQNKQIKFNQEIESLNQSIEGLQLECHELESQIMTAKAVHRTRSKLSNISGTISRGEKHAAF